LDLVGRRIGGHSRYMGWEIKIRNPRRLLVMHYDRQSVVVIPGRAVSTNYRKQFFQGSPMRNCASEV